MNSELPGTGTTGASSNIQQAIMETGERPPVTVQDAPAVERALHQLGAVLSSALDEPTPNLDAGTTYLFEDDPSWTENTSLLRNLRFADTPDHNITVAGKQQRGYHGMSLLEDTVLGDDTSLMEEPARRIVSEELIIAFHRELSNHSFKVLDMISALEKCCDVQLCHLSSFRKQTKFPVDQAELWHERATWQLMHVLAHDRLEEEEEEKGATKPILLGGDRASEKELAEQFFVHDSRVRQAQLVVDWLEGLAKAGLGDYHIHHFTDNVCWENTLHDITHGIDRESLVTEMDTDAPTRQQRKLSVLDVRAELALNKHLFTCIRAGQLDMVHQVCVDSGQPLKALQLEGWKLHHDPNKNKSITDELESIEGNVCRDMWKNTCWQMCEEPNYDVFEKAVFAALSGNVQKVLPACQSWYDYVWAYFKTAVDVQVEKVLRSRSTLDQQDPFPLPEQYWNAVLLPQQIFQEIESSSTTEIKHESQSHFHLVQKYFILGDIAGLLEEMVSWLSSQPSLHRLRFMAHVSLVARELALVKQNCHVDSILEAYVKALIDGRHQSAVALYAAKLPANSQISSYAHLLLGVKDEQEQRHCLELGRQAGLDIGMITRTVVERIRNTTDTEDDYQGFISDQNISELDMEKIRALNWLLFEESQRHEAIKQGNALMRQFLTVHKFSSAKAVLEKIPEDSVQVVTKQWQARAALLPLHITTDLTQLQALKTYVIALDKFNIWFQHFHHHKPIEPQEQDDGTFYGRTAFEHKLAEYKVEYEQWKSKAMSLAEEASSSLNDVLTFPGGWMSPVTEDKDDPLMQQFEALHQSCIPEVCFLLHSVLHTSSLYAKCLLISDLVADEDYKLYKTFTQSQLQQLLMLLGKSTLKQMCEGNN